MARRAARVDTNQPEIVKALEAVGASVEYLFRLGQGVPDLLVGFRSENHILEVKDGSKPPSKRKLTPDEKAWHAKWQGKVAVVASVDEALRLIGAIE